MRPTQGAQSGEEKKRASAARAQHRQRGLDYRVGEGWAVRVRRQAFGKVKQRLARKIERARPAARGRLRQAELAREMAELLAHREGRRGEDPRTRMVVHLAAEE